MPINVAHAATHPTWNAAKQKQQQKTQIIDNKIHLKLSEAIVSAKTQQHINHHLINFNHKMSKSIERIKYERE